MVRSWDARVRGAAGKVTPETDASSTETDASSTEAEEVRIAETVLEAVSQPDEAVQQPEDTARLELVVEHHEQPSEVAPAPDDHGSELVSSEESEFFKDSAQGWDLQSAGIDPLDLVPSDAPHPDTPQLSDANSEPDGPELSFEGGDQVGQGNRAEASEQVGGTASNDLLPPQDPVQLVTHEDESQLAADQDERREDERLDDLGVNQRDRTAEVVIEGLALAVDSVGLSMAVVDRLSGQILWSSEGWTSRFGVQSLLSRHWPSATDLGESPLPDIDESWQRNRTMLLADGTEELVELLLIGASTKAHTSFVTVVAIEADASGTQISDRAEVIGVIEGALQLSGDRKNGSTTGSKTGSSLPCVAVLYVDLDRFKVVHDLVGNMEALRLLELVSRQIRATMREKDLFFRLPSDEFVIVATDLERMGAAEELADRIRIAVATLADVGHDMALTASIGVALAEPNQSGDELLSAAETAVYLAKGRGRNRIAVHDEELRAKSQRLLVVERQLRRAIDRKDVRFAYQAVVHMPTGAVVGAEALLRLGGEVGLSAMEVITAAEHSGLMGALGSLVVEGVNEQLFDLLRSSERNFEVMVNLSGTQMEDEALLQTLTRLGSDPSIPPGRLTVEVPEAVVEENRGAFLRLAELVRPSFKLGIDGFGTMLSSSTAFESLPIDYVKLHRSLTGTGMADAGRDRVAELVADANAQGVTVIALGVESLEQANVLQSVGCSLAQGFLYAGAVAARDLLELVDVGFGESATVL